MNRWHLLIERNITLITISLQISHLKWGFSVHSQSFLVALVPVRRLHSILGENTWCVCVSLVYGREGVTGWVCNEDTLWAEGWAACCGCFGSSEWAVQSSGSERGHVQRDLPVVESSGGLQHCCESPAGWSCREDEQYMVGKSPLGSWQRGAGSCMTRMYSWVHLVWALSRQTCTPDAAPCLSCRRSRGNPGEGCRRDQAEEGRRRGGNKTRPRSVSYQGSVSCTGVGGFLKSSSPLQRETQKILPWFLRTSELEKSSHFNIKQVKKLRKQQNVQFIWLHSKKIIFLLLSKVSKLSTIKEQFMFYPINYQVPSNYILPAASTCNPDGDHGEMGHK